MTHLSLGSRGTYMTTTSVMQDAYCHSTHMQTTAVPVEEASGQEQVVVQMSNDHSTPCKLISNCKVYRRVFLHEEGCEG
jgi:hypothetical protein